MMAISNNKQNICRLHKKKTNTIYPIKIYHPTVQCDVLHLFKLQFPKLDNPLPFYMIINLPIPSFLAHLKHPLRATRNASRMLSFAFHPKFLQIVVHKTFHFTYST